MNKFMQENYALIVGITLPLALMLLFFIAGNTTRVTIDDPQYDVVFVTNLPEIEGKKTYDIKIEDGKLEISRIEGGQWPQIYIFDHTTQTSRLVDIDFNNVVNGMVSDPDIDALNQHKLSTAETSPDGYSLQYHHRSSDVGIAGDFFGFGRHYGEDYALIKGPRIVRLKSPQPIYQAKFVAWVADGEGKK